MINTGLYPVWILHHEGFCAYAIVQWVPKWHINFTPLILYNLYKGSAQKELKCQFNKSK